MRLIKEQDLFTVLLLDNFQCLLPDRQANMQPEMRRMDPNELAKIGEFISDIVKDSAKVNLLVTSSEVVFLERGQRVISLQPLVRITHSSF